jgi:Ca2+-dependent lipid-binding protein
MGDSCKKHKKSNMKKKKFVENIKTDNSPISGLSRSDPGLFRPELSRDPVVSRSELSRDTVVSRPELSREQNKKEIDLPEQSQGEQDQEEVSEFTSVITYSITQEMIKHFLTIIRESNNYNKIKGIIDDLTSTILNKVAPYLYSILAILVIMFFMNCFQFYYYLRSMSKGISSEIM